MANTMASAPIAQELARLRDIHMPGAISWWPLAPGWYLLAFLLIVLVLTTVYLLARFYRNNRAKRHALRLLATYQQQYQTNANNQLSAARISELLKRVALVYFPRAKVASLQGDAWIAFLNATAKGINFEHVRTELLEAPYQSDLSLDLNPLFQMVRTWIRQRRGPHV